MFSAEVAVSSDPIQIREHGHKQHLHSRLFEKSLDRDSSKTKPDMKQVVVPTSSRTLTTMLALAAATSALGIHELWPQATAGRDMCSKQSCQEVETPFHTVWD